MLLGHIWVDGIEGANLHWQEGAQLRTNFLTSWKIDETLISPDWLSSPVVQAFRCSACGAITTDFSKADQS